jgi:hypothetical protein
MGRAARARVLEHFSATNFDAAGAAILGRLQG